MDICEVCRQIGGWHRVGCSVGDAEIAAVFAALEESPSAKAVEAIEAPTRDKPTKEIGP